jgi:hypothetical protein
VRQNGEEVEDVSRTGFACKPLMAMVLQWIFEQMNIDTGQLLI